MKKKTNHSELKSPPTNFEQALEAHKETEKSFLIILRSLPFAVFAIDKNQKFVWANKYAEKQTGYSKKELLAMHVTDIDKSTFEMVRQGFKKDYETIKPGQYKTLHSDHFVKKEGGLYPAEIILTPIIFRKKHVMLAIVEDITKRKKAEKKLLKKEEQLIELNAAKDKFFSIIAHDLKSPLNGIVGMSSLILEKSSEGDLKGVQEMSALMSQAAEQYSDLLNNLLEWAQMQSGRKKFRPARIDLCDIAEKLIPLFILQAREKNIEIKMDCPHLIIKADPNMFKTVMRNLVSNAIKFSKPGGTVELKGRKTKKDVEISVRDNGVGMNKTLQKKLFKIGEDFITRGTYNEKGTGLGLILCKEFVELHGGKIHVRSEEGKGTLFWFNLPL